MFSLMNSLSGAVGQCKWLLFHRGQEPLSRLSTLDGASRDPFGSLMLICKAEWHGLLPTLGALLIVATVAVNPFMQQLIHIELANPEQGSGLLPVAYDLGKTPVDGFFTGNVTLKAAAYAGFFSPPSM
jgi:hypothetical protein